MFKEVYFPRRKSLVFSRRQFVVYDSDERNAHFCDVVAAERVRSKVGVDLHLNLFYASA